MSDRTSTYVHSPQGPMHTGSGDVNVLQFLAEARGPGPRLQALDELTWIWQRFIYPEGFGQAREILALDHAVFLDAPTGSGRLAAAKVLLWELRAGAERFHELLPQENKNRLDLSLVDAGDRIWLDLSGAAGPEWSTVRGELSSLRKAVLDNSAYLVVVLPHAADGLSAELSQFRVRLKPPSARAVLSRHLRCAGLAPSGVLPPLEYLDQAWPLEEIPGFVYLIGAAREQRGGSGDLADWCEAAYKSWLGRRADVGERVADLAGQARALLLTTAMLHDAHADTIHKGCQILLKIAQHPSDGSSLLQVAPLGKRLENIGARIGSTGHVVFKEPGYDEAVRAFFWKNSPELHGPLSRWVAEISDSAALRPGGDLERLARRFGAQCREERYRPLWAALVERWTADSKPTRMMSAASLILQDGLSDKRHGRVYRRQIYDWSRSSLPDQLAAVLVAVCRDHMAVNHPDEALVRLHHLARRESRTLARDALLDLARSDRRFLRQLLGRLAGQSPEGRLLEADVGLFLQLADPRSLTERGRRDRALIEEPDVRSWLTTCWHLAFARPPSTWSSQARDWLWHAAEDEPCRHALLDVLIAAGHLRADVLALLFTLRDRRQQSLGLGELMLQKISTAQGLSFTGLRKDMRLP